jgi:cyclopropane-fatty-acyl-phospholipid synthase
LPGHLFDDAAIRVALAAAERIEWVRALHPVRRLGFDDRFIRMWEYYLALSEAGFATGLTQDLQIVMEKTKGLDRNPRA